MKRLILILALIVFAGCAAEKQVGDGIVEEATEEVEARMDEAAEEIEPDTIG